MSLGIPVLINQNRSYWLSSIGNDVIHSTIQVQELDASVGRFSTLYSDLAEFSTLNVSTLNLQNSDVSGMYVSSIRGNTAFFSTVTLASDLSGGVGFVRFSVDASGIQVDGDPIRFDNLVYLTSTINIVQVSTIVDTDIFAQNGYFSTLSSQNLQFNQGLFSSLQGGNGSFSSLVVSSLAATDISGDFAKNWSQYQTLNSSIIFQPSYILSNVSNKLFFAGQELTDMSGGGVNWSLFPALSTVNMNNNSLIGLSTLRFQDNATLTSVTGNNLFYNGQPIQYGNTSNVSQWANFNAVNNVNMNNNSLNNVNGVSTTNLSVLSNFYNNDYTWLNTLEVGGTTLTPLMAVTSGGDVVCRNLQVGDSTTSLADVEIYGATAVPGDNALYVEGGVTFDGGLIHGFSAGVIPVAGINTGRIDMLQAGFNLLHPLVGVITTGGALSLAAGGAMSLAGGGYIEMNTSTLQMINTTQGNKNTTIQAGYLTVDPDIANTNSVKLFNTLGGGVEIDGGGQGSLIGFSTVRSSNLSSINLDVSTINGVPLSSIQTPDNIVCSNINVSQSSIANAFYGNNMTITGTAGANLLTANQTLFVSSTAGNFRVNNIQIPDNITGITNAPNPLQSRIENFSSIQSGAMSTGDIRLSSINGINWNDISGGGGGSALSTFNQLFTSSIQLSSIFHGGFAGQREIIVDGNGFNFKNADPTLNARYISSLQYVRSPGINLDIEASTMLLSYAGGINPNGNIRLGSGGAFDAWIYGNNTVFSTPVVQANSTFAQTISTGALTISTVSAVGGLGIKFNNYLEFTTPTGIENLTAVNFANQTGIPELNIYASTINLAAANTTIGSLSTAKLSTSALAFSTATSVGSNTAFNYPLYIEYDQGGNISTGGVAIAVQGHNLGSGAVRNQIEFGARGNGENYITSVWPGQNLEDLYIDATDVIFRDGTFSTIVNLDPYGLITNGAISAPSLLVSSINGNDARPAFTNNLMLSTMELYAASTTLMYWDSTTTSSNINSSGYDVVAGLNGHFKIGASFQFVSGGTSDEVEFFLLKNNSVISQSGGIIELENNAELVTYAESIESLVNGDTIQVGCYTQNAGVYVSTINGAVIQSPAVILTMYKVD